MRLTKYNAEVFKCRTYGSVFRKILEWMAERENRPQMFQKQGIRIPRTHYGICAYHDDIKRRFRDQLIQSPLDCANLDQAFTNNTENQASVRDRLAELFFPGKRGAIPDEFYWWGTPYRRANQEARMLALALAIAVVGKEKLPYQPTIPS